MRKKLHYQLNIVLMTFRCHHHEELQPDAQRLIDYDAHLFDTYDAEVSKQAPEHGIPDSLFNRSILVFFANCSRAKAPAVRVRHACTYFDAVHPVP